MDDKSRHQWKDRMQGRVISLECPGKKKKKNLDKHMAEDCETTFLLATVRRKKSF